MTVTGIGHHQGDPSQMCESIEITGSDWDDAKKLALLFRVLSDPAKRERLLAAAEEIESTEAAAVDYVTG